MFIIYIRNKKNLSLEAEIPYQKRKRKEVQELLKILYKKQEKAKEHGEKYIYLCGCRYCKENECAGLLITRSRSRDFFVLRSYKNHKEKHDHRCPLRYSNDKLFVQITQKENTKGKKNKTVLKVTTPSVFLDTETNYNNYKKQDRQKDLQDKEREFKEILTYHKVINHTLAEAYAISFNRINRPEGKRIDRLSGNLNLPSINQVIKQFRRLLFPNIKVKINGSFINYYEFCKKNSLLTITGIIVDDIRKLDFSSSSKSIPIKIISIEKRKIQEISIYVKKKHLKQIRQFSNTYANVPPPYFIVLIYNYKKKTSEKALIKPIISDNIEEPYCNIDSDLEKTFAKELSKIGIPFFKPIDEEWKSIITSPYSKYLNKYIYTPDFIVFSPRKISIIEITGIKCSQTYKKLIERKMQTSERIMNRNPYVKFIFKSNISEILKEIKG